ncbi:MAG: hypothetical protein AAFQ94_02450 [Bacteroidota bacterium]
MEKALVTSGILKPTEKRIDKWMKQGKTDLLLFALDKVLYKTREKILVSLREKGDVSVIPHITKLIDDDVQAVSEAAIETIEKLAGNNLKDDLSKRLQAKKDYWVEQERQESVRKMTGYTGILRKIKDSEYDRYIAIKNTSFEYLFAMIEDLGGVSGDDYLQDFEFSYKALNKDWKLIKVDDKLDFFTFHNLIGWFYGYEDSKQAPEVVVGFAEHHTESSKNYFCFLDSTNLSRDTIVGAFDNEENFFIFLPDAFEEGGNLTVTDSFRIDVEAEKKYYAENGLIVSEFEIDLSKKLIKMNVPED